jgi:hypothetical protein
LVSQVDEQKFTIVILLDVLTVSVLFFKLTLICFYYSSYNTLLSHLQDGQIKVRKNGLKVFVEINKQVIMVEEN